MNLVMFVPGGRVRLSWELGFTAAGAFTTRDKGELK